MVTWTGERSVAAAAADRQAEQAPHMVIWALASGLAPHLRSAGRVHELVLCRFTAVWEQFNGRPHAYL